MKKLVYILTSTVVLTACSGSSSNDSGSSGGPGQDPLSTKQTATAAVAQQVCSTLKFCHTNLTAANCTLYGQTNFGTRLGLPSPNSESLATIHNREAAGDYKPNVSALNSCLQDIRDLDCVGSAVQNGYNPNAADPFARAAEMLSPFCANVLTL